MKQNAKYFFVWVEGLEAKTGEKIKRFRDDGSIEYTLEMMDAMRVRKKDIPAVEDKMRSHGIANWVMESQNTFIGTSYAPKGTIFGSSEFYKK
ncbi:MAG TPA: hypothetical protein VMX17_09600 [Candidatus Glassbacteria bacterium]|nr:hypothetical protein [Candidatus Glassbacteria bacterium]